jgi:hypothetical protein
MTRAEAEQLREDLKQLGLCLCYWDGSKGYGPPYWYPAPAATLTGLTRGKTITVGQRHG